MNEEKQIEEMAHIMRNNEDACQVRQCLNCKYENCDYTICLHMLSAEFLYNAGYRKASEIFEEIETELKKIARKGYVGNMSDIFAELKKKYI